MAYFEFKYIDPKTAHPICAKMYANAESENPIEVGQIDHAIGGLFRAHMLMPGASSYVLTSREEAAMVMITEMQNWFLRMGLRIEEEND